MLTAQLAQAHASTHEDAELFQPVTGGDGRVPGRSPSQGTAQWPGVARALPPFAYHRGVVLVVIIIAPIMTALQSEGWIAGNEHRCLP